MSAKDRRTYRLVRHGSGKSLACGHLTELNRKLTHGELKKPYRDDAILETIIERGNPREAAYVGHLRRALTCLGSRPGNDQGNAILEFVLTRFDR